MREPNLFDPTISSSDIMAREALRLAGNPGQLRKTPNPLVELKQVPDQIPAAPVNPQPPEPQQPAAPPSYFQKYGVTGYDSDDRFIEDLIEMARSSYELRQELDSLKQQVSQPQEPAPAREPQPEPEAPVDPVDQLLSKFSAPEYEPHWEQMCEKDPNTGQWIPLNGVMPQTAQKLNEYYNWQNTASKQFMQPDFFRNFADAVAQRAVANVSPDIEKVREQVRRDWEQEQQQQQGVSTYQSFIEENKQSFWEYDETGQPKRDPITNEFRLTEQGQKFLDLRKQAEDMATRYYGEPNEQFINDYAMQHWQPAEEPQQEPIAETPSEPQQPEPTPEPPAEPSNLFAKMMQDAQNEPPPAPDASGNREPGDEPVPNFRDALEGTMKEQGLVS